MAPDGVRILIVQPSSLGAVAFTLPVLADIRAARAGAVIDWVVEPAFAPLVRRAAGIGEVIEAPLARWGERWWSGTTRKEWSALKQRLQRTPYDAVIDLHGGTGAALVARAAQGQRFRLPNTHGGTLARWLSGQSLTMPLGLHELDRTRLAVARVIGAKAEGRPAFGLPERRPLAERRPTIVFAHGSAHPDRLWADARWIALGRRFVEAGWQIALPHGNELEQVRSEQLAAAMDSQATAFLDTGYGAGATVQVWPRMRLDPLLERLSEAHGLIGVDSGLTRVGVALGLPLVQVFMEPSAAVSGPLRAHGRRHQVAVGGDRAPSVDEVWAAWHRVYTAADGRDHVAA